VNKLPEGGNPSPNHNECSKKTLLLFQTVSKQLEGLDGKIDTLRNDLVNGTINYVELKAQHDSLCKEVDENIKPRIKEIEEAIDNQQKEDNSNFKSLAGWIFGAIGIVIAILIAIRW
jgi:SMC interacting uncharacterized protein involved in chromosome segregation